MVARGAGAVGCAHCTQIGAEVSCQICTRLVCPTCAANWATCGEPSGRLVRLGLTARVRDVDPLGRIALVSHWRRPLRLFDLRRLAWIEGELPRHYWLVTRLSDAPPRLSEDGRLFHADPSAVANDILLTDMRSHDLRTGAVHVISHHAPFGSVGVSTTNNRFYYVTETQQVAITNNDTQHAIALDHVWLVEPLPRKVLHSAHVDGERMLLAAGSWSELVLHEIVDGTLRRLGYTKTDAVGDVRWIAVAGPWLVAIIANELRNAQVEVRRLDTNLSLGAVEHRFSCLRRSVAALSRDGRYFACATSDGLRVHELGTDNVTTFDEHSDSINYVRFAADDHVLISADTDNRIVMRPRTPTGYARPLVSIQIPEDTVPMPTFERAPR